MRKLLTILLLTLGFLTTSTDAQKRPSPKKAQTSKAKTRDRSSLVQPRLKQPAPVQPPQKHDSKYYENIFDDALNNAWQYVRLPFSIIVLMSFAFAGIKYKYSRGGRLGKEYGSARWATDRELRKEKILRRPQSILEKGELFLGIYPNGEIAVLPANRAGKHTEIKGITGSGKTESILAPNIVKASWEESLFINDTKTGEGSAIGELWIKTSGYRPGPIYFAPMDPLRNMLKFNPVPTVRRNAKMALKFAEAILGNATSDGSNSAHFFLSAKPLVAACWLHAAETKFANLVTVYKILMLPLDDMKFVLENSPSPEARLAIREFLDTSEKEAGSVMTTTRNAHQFMMCSEIEQFCWTNTATDFSQLLRKKNHSIYYQMRDDDAEMLKPLNSLIFSCILAQIKPVKGFFVKMLLDEFANFGKIPNFEKEIALLRSKKISVTACVQSYRSQIDDIYGKHKASTIIGNFNNHVALPGLLVTDAKMISDQVGIATVTASSASRRVGSIMDGSNTVSSHSQPLMSADEIVHMPEEQILVSRCSELHPFVLTRENYTTPEKSAPFRPIKQVVIPENLADDLVIAAHAYAEKAKKQKRRFWQRKRPKMPDWN